MNQKGKSNNNPSEEMMDEDNFKLPDFFDFLIWIPTGLPVFIFKSIFSLIKSIFSFKRFYIGYIIAFLHFASQALLIYFILKVVPMIHLQEMGNGGYNYYWSTSSWAMYPFGIESGLIFWFLGFLWIRIFFELILIVFGIHNKLADIVKLLEKEKK